MMLHHVYLKDLEYLVTWITKKKWESSLWRSLEMSLPLFCMETLSLSSSNLEMPVLEYSVWDAKTCETREGKEVLAFVQSRIVEDSALLDWVNFTQSSNFHHVCTVTRFQILSSSKSTSSSPQMRNHHMPTWPLLVILYFLCNYILLAMFGHKLEIYSTCMTACYPKPCADLGS